MTNLWHHLHNRHAEQIQSFIMNETEREKKKSERVESLQGKRYKNNNNKKERNRQSISICGSQKHHLQATCCIHPCGLKQPIITKKTKPTSNNKERMQELETMSGEWKCSCWFLLSLSFQQELQDDWMSWKYISGNWTMQSIQEMSGIFRVTTGYFKADIRVEMPFLFLHPHPFSFLCVYWFLFLSS